MPSLPGSLPCSFLPSLRACAAICEVAIPTVLALAGLQRSIFRAIFSVYFAGLFLLIHYLHLVHTVLLLHHSFLPNCRPN